MDDQGRQNLPNLKICVDNTEEGELSESDESLEQEIAIDVDENEKIDDPKSAEVEFSIRISDSTSENKTKSENYTKKYENKDGDFITGIDLTSKEALEKKEERARRFGIDVKENQVADVDIKRLYASLGLKEEDFNKGERGVRPEAIHMRGTDHMSTQDVFRYFKEFAPGGIEWIDDASCNAVWADPITAARAMLKLSESYESVMGIQQNKNDRQKTKHENVKSAEKGNSEEKDTETAMEVEDDDDNLDLLGGDNENKDKKNEMKMDSDSSETESLKQKELNSAPTDGSKGDEEGQGDIDKTKDKRSRISWPPGKWRLGHTKHKSNNLFFRFATKADKKLPRAESRSKYYQKYGNPNYGGMKGLISTSRKQRYRAKTFEEELAETKAAIESNRAEREARERGDEEEEELDIPRISPLKRKRGPTDEAEGEELDMEAELQELLGPPVRKQRSMRMYADDEEEMRNTRRRLGGSGGVMTVIASSRAHLPVGRVKDARELIRRGGTRSKLMMDRECEASPDSIPLSQAGNLRMRIQESPPKSVSDNEEEEEDSKGSWSEDDTDQRPSILSRLGPAGRASGDSDSDSGDSERNFGGRLGVHSSVGRVRSDLRSRLGAQKRQSDNSKYPSMRIEVFE